MQFWICGGELREQQRTHTYPDVLATEPLKGHVKYINYRSLDILLRSLEIPIAFPRNTFAFSRNTISKY